MEKTGNLLQAKSRKGNESALHPKPGNPHSQILLTENILHQKFVEYGRKAKEWMRKCVLLLLEIEKHRVWEKKGFSSIYEYAAKLAGMSRDQVNEGLRILRKIEDKPELQKIVEKKGVLAIRPVVTIATKETDKFWAEKAKEMSVRTLETYVREIRNQENDFHRIIRLHVEASQVEKVTLSMELEPEIAQQLEKIKGRGDWNELMKELLRVREEKLESQKPIPVETDSRYIPAKIKKYVLNRTNHTCAFPRCTKPYKILHHTKRFALNKAHHPNQLVPLCKTHERLVHLGLVENEEMPPKFWRLRKEPDRNQLKYQIDRKVAKHYLGVDRMENRAPLSE